MPMNWFMALNVVCCDAGGGLAGELGQAVEQIVARQIEDRAERIRQVAAAEQSIVDRAGDVLLIGAGVGRQDRRQQAGIERQQHVVADIAQHRIAREIVRPSAKLAEVKVPFSVPAVMMV